MSARFKLIISAITIAALLMLITLINDIRQTSILLGHVSEKLARIEHEFAQYQSLVKTVNQIDSKFSQELANERDKNSELYNNVLSGIGQLQLNVGQTAAARVDDANACELTGDARQNYYLLREDLTTKQHMILGLQAYINQVCLAD